MDAEILEFPGGTNVYGSGKRVFGNRSTSKNWKHMVTIIMGLTASISRMFLVYAPCSPHIKQGHSPHQSRGYVCPPCPAHPDPRVGSSSTEACSLSLFPRSPRPRASPWMEAEDSSLPTGSADAACPKRITEAHLGLAPSYRTRHEAAIF